MITQTTSSTSGPSGRAAVPLRGSPFDLGDTEAYRRWRAEKLDGFPGSVHELLVEVEDPSRPREFELASLRNHLRRANMVVYRCAGRAMDREALRSFGRALGLSRLDTHLCAEEDGISQLTVSDRPGRAGDYVPYSNRPLSWHCDGYYNESAHAIRAMLLHCVRPAAEGGENALMDHEMLYIALRDASSEYIEALMHPEALAIPANVQNGAVLRPERVGPVFSVDPLTGALHMRYTARGRNIRWRDDPATRAAAECIARLLDAPDAPVFRLRLQAGDGLLCNNVLHNRTGFTDYTEPERKRLVYRARYLDRVAET